MFVQGLKQYQGNVRSDLKKRFNSNKNKKLSEKNKDLVKYKVLIVENSFSIVYRTVRYLEKCGCNNITIAASGCDAIKKFTSDFNLVFITPLLPDISAHYVIDYIKKKSSSLHIPIIGYLTKKGYLKAKSVIDEFDDQITKPFAFNDFKMLLERWLF